MKYHQIIGNIEKNAESSILARHKVFSIMSIEDNLYRKGSISYPDTKSNLL